MAKEPKCATDGGGQWVSTLLDDVRISNPLVVDHVLGRMESLLKGSICDQELPATTLKTLAIELIGDMVSKTVDPKEIQ